MAYDPAQYTVQEFEQKLIRFAEGLEKVQQPMAFDELQYLLMKAHYARLIVGGTKEDQIKALKEMIGDLMLEKTSTNRF